MVQKSQGQPAGMVPKPLWVMGNLPYQLNWWSPDFSHQQYLYTLPETNMGTCQAAFSGANVSSREGNSIYIYIYIYIYIRYTYTYEYVCKYMDDT